MAIDPRLLSALVESDRLSELDSKGGDLAVIRRLLEGWIRQRLTDEEREELARALR